MALELGRLGTCCRLQVGAVLLRPDGGIAAAGINGALPGMPHCDGPVRTAYVTHEPCLTCARALVRRGVRRVVFRHPYASIAEQERAERAAILGHFGVSWEHLSA